MNVEEPTVFHPSVSPDDYFSTALDTLSLSDDASSNLSFSTSASYPHTISSTNNHNNNNNNDDDDDDLSSLHFNPSNYSSYYSFGTNETQCACKLCHKMETMMNMRTDDTTCSFTSISTSNSSLLTEEEAAFLREAEISVRALSSSSIATEDNDGEDEDDERHQRSRYDTLPTTTIMERDFQQKALKTRKHVGSSRHHHNRRRKSDSSLCHSKQQHLPKLSTDKTPQQRHRVHSKDKPAPSPSSSSRQHPASVPSSPVPVSSSLSSSDLGDLKRLAKLQHRRRQQIQLEMEIKRHSLDLAIDVIKGEDRLRRLQLHRTKLIQASQRRLLEEQLEALEQLQEEQQEEEESSEGETQTEVKE